MPYTQQKEQTGRQSTQNAGGAFAFFPTSLINAPPPGDIATYKKMRNHPTVALSRAISTAPMLAAEPSLELEEGEDETKRKQVQELLEDIYPQLIHDCMYAIDYGFKPFEIIWGVKTPEGASTPMISPTRVKSLSVERTKPVIEDDGDELLGIENFGKKLSKEYVLWLTHDCEDCNYYGRSRFENIRDTAYTGWTTTFKKQLMYFSKVAGTIPMIQYPPGQEQTADGSLKSNYEIANMIMKQISSGNGVIMPNTLAAGAQDLLDRGVPLDKVKAWIIEFVEASGQHGSDFDVALRYYDSLLMRGYIVPERAGIEGQHGTKAEAGVHTDIVLSVAQLTLNNLFGQINKQLIWPMNVLNWGEDHERDITLVAPPLQDDKRELIEQIMIAAFTAGGAELLDTWCDVDQLLETLDLPVVAGVDKVSGLLVAKKDAERQAKIDQQTAAVKAVGAQVPPEEAGAGAAGIMASLAMARRMVGGRSGSMRLGGMNGRLH